MPKCYPLRSLKKDLTLPLTLPLTLNFYYFVNGEQKEITFEVFPNGTNIIIDDNILATPNNLTLFQLFTDISQEITEIIDNYNLPIAA